MSSINIKITLAIAVVLAIVLFAIAAALFSTQTAGERRFAQVQNYALTDLLIKSIEFSMGGGIFDVSPLESDLNEMDGVVDFRVVSSEKLKGESDVILDDEGCCGYNPRYASALYYA
ncbi:MAG: hypothetical protein CMN78_06605, partial [Spirochaetales bacterium]|nr:hypothetical protein [Spirochaetales bacterium]